MSLTTSSIAPTPPTSVLPPEVQRALGRVTEIGSLPEVTARILEVVENPKATARNVHEVVRADPALAAKILKIVNSAFYGLPSQIASLDRAIVMLGLSALKNLALASSLIRLFRGQDISEEFTARDLWRHCLAVGVCARLIAQAGKVVQRDEAFVAGLTHDLGLIVAAQVFPEQLRQVVQRTQAESASFVACETEIIGADHQLLGAAIATKWKFPPNLRNAIGYHHDPLTLQPEFQKLAAAIALADVLCNALHIGFWLTTPPQEPPEWMLTLLGLSPESLPEIAAQVPDQLAEAEQIFSS
jgi:putative nucleotidyltransferase with HDIG domain